MTSGAIQLSLLGLPQIDSLADLSDAIHISKGLLYKCTKYPAKQYRTYTIPKSSGGSRLISQPSKVLKAIQGWILRNMLDKLSVSPACKGFVTGASTRDNAVPHIGATAAASIDIEDFFPSVKATHVFSVFRTIGYSPRVASLLTSLCTHNGGLPQGAPTSPALANLVCIKLDARISGYVGKRGINYTRYADDLTFSSFSYANLIRSLPFIRKIVESEGYSLNERKTRVSGPARRHTVTGLVVTSEDVGIGRESYRELRATLHRLATKPTTAAGKIEIMKVKGFVAYLNSVDDVRRKRLDKYLDGLRRKYPKSALALLW